MLKHVKSQTRCQSSSALTNQKSDTLSINSNMSFASLVEPALSSRSSSYTSLNETQSSTGSASVPAASPTTTIKVYTRCLRPDLEYKTMSVKYNTSCRDLVDQLLNKYRMKHRDPNLFFLTMEVATKGTGASVRTILVLDDESCPAELQACYPRADSKFTVRMRRGGLVKVQTSHLMPGSTYKSLLVSERTSTDQLVRLLLDCFNLPENSGCFSLFEVSRLTACERRLRGNERPLVLQQGWPATDGYSFVLMKRPPGTPRIGRDFPLRRSFLQWRRGRSLSVSSLGPYGTEQRLAGRCRSPVLSLAPTLSLAPVVDQSSALYV